MSRCSTLFLTRAHAPATIDSTSPVPTMTTSNLSGSASMVARARGFLMRKKRSPESSKSTR